MTKITLTQIDASSIQDYIFGSNNLRQNVGASELVYRSTTQWVDEALTTTLGNRDKHNVEWDEKTGDLIFKPGLTVANDQLQAEVVYAGGGNTLILFKGEPEVHAIPFAKILSTRMVKEARGLRLGIDHAVFEWENQALATVHSDLRKLAMSGKAPRPISMPLLGLGVTAACNFTGLPAVGRDHDDLVSQEAKHKAEAHKQALARLHNVLPKVRKGKYAYEFVDDFDLLGEKHESSFMAVVHADGNGMGKRFEAIAAQYPRPEDNAEYVIRLRRLSEGVKENSIKALRATVDLLIRDREQTEGEDFGYVVPVPKKNGVNYLPFRPIVFGGDDTTFVCEGRLGLTLAKKFLEVISQEPLPGLKEGQEGEPLYARAGVAVVKSHYPFSRAYELSEALVASAKKELKEMMVNEKGSVIDWHFSTSGIIVPLDQLRNREYAADNGDSLLMRPVWVDVGEAPTVEAYWRSWQNFDYVTSVFNGRARNPEEAKPWAERRNKILALRTALRQGSEAVEQFRESYEQSLLPVILESPTDNIQDNKKTAVRQTGWHPDKHKCGYFDAIEAMDFYVPLYAGENEQ